VRCRWHPTTQRNADVSGAGADDLLEYARSYSPLRWSRCSSGYSLHIRHAVGDRGQAVFARCPDKKSSSSS